MGRGGDVDGEAPGAVLAVGDQIGAACAELTAMTPKASTRGGADSKNVNNPVGQGGGQRKQLSRAERQNNGPAPQPRQAHRRAPCRRPTMPHRTDAPLSRCR
ncbi:hypothetical protein GCM10010425_70330 [Streptomyces spororaveus]|uniref:Uncharacterized protein n=1 Tax=Streptomyces spororaveus TaxID=284039 RepID=A0ABQ3T827_9ACTN|nr:hypothetical protein Sspor_21250 [Streptomyces spororaveus]